MRSRFVVASKVLLALMLQKDITVALVILALSAQIIVAQQCVPTIISTNLLTPWSRVLLKKLRVRSASQEIPLILWNPRFITVFTRARRLSLSWAQWILQQFLDRLILTSQVPLLHCSWSCLITLLSNNGACPRRLVSIPPHKFVRPPCWYYRV
jgi:hypothetical protein